MTINSTYLSLPLAFEFNMCHYLHIQSSSLSQHNRCVVHVNLRNIRKYFYLMPYKPDSLASVFSLFRIHMCPVNLIVTLFVCYFFTLKSFLFCLNSLIDLHNTQENKKYRGNRIFDPLQLSHENKNYFVMVFNRISFNSFPKQNQPHCQHCWHLIQLFYFELTFFFKRKLNRFLNHLFYIVLICCAVRVVIRVSRSRKSKAGSFYSIYHQWILMHI